MTDSLWYPSADDVLDIHEDIVSEYPDTSPGVQRRGDIEFALAYVSEESFGKVPRDDSRESVPLASTSRGQSPVRGR